MFHIILFEPEIPPNAGNIIRLCVNTGCELHFIEPLGFSVDEKSFKRAGMDYMKKKDFHVWNSLENCMEKVSASRYFTISTKGQNKYTDVDYEKGDFPKQLKTVARFINSRLKSNRLVCSFV